MSAWSEPDVKEVIAAVVASGVAVNTWTILSDSNRLVLAIEPCAWIVKAVRIGVAERLATEVALARHISSQGGPAAPPVPGSSVLLGKTVAVSLWEPVTILAWAPARAVSDTYLDLRRYLDSFTGPLPDFREAISRAAGLLDTPGSPRLTAHDSALLHAVFSSGLPRLSEFQWTPHVLHGDPHEGNIVSTPNGPRWLDFESACTGPLEWDLSALPDSARPLVHPGGLFDNLIRLRSACVVAWCSTKPNPGRADLDAIAHHLAVLRAETRP